MVAQALDFRPWPILRLWLYSWRLPLGPVLKPKNLALACLKFSDRRSNCWHQNSGEGCTGGTASLFTVRRSLDCLSPHAWALREGTSASFIASCRQPEGLGMPEEAGREALFVRLLMDLEATWAFALFGRASRLWHFEYSFISVFL
jgi:hypothetical protein